MDIKKLTGITGFINGQKDLHEMEDDLCELLNKIGKETLIIDNLFEEPYKLINITKCENLVFSTTGTYASKIETLLDAFEKMNYAPKNVIFMSENTALFFCGYARELKAKHGTNFFFYFKTDIGDELDHVGWI